MPRLPDRLPTSRQVPLPMPLPPTLPLRRAPRMGCGQRPGDVERERRRATEDCHSTGLAVIAHADGQSPSSAHSSFRRRHSRAASLTWCCSVWALRSLAPESSAWCLACSPGGRISTCSIPQTQRPCSVLSAPPATTLYLLASKSGHHHRAELAGGALPASSRTPASRWTDHFVAITDAGTGTHEARRIRLVSARRSSTHRHRQRVLGPRSSAWCRRR